MNLSQFFQKQIAITTHSGNFIRGLCTYYSPAHPSYQPNASIGIAISAGQIIEIFENDIQSITTT